jgi:cytochrome oxidase Cu insertion factor (SCO1/SenC/PrrC family)
MRSFAALLMSGCLLGAADPPRRPQTGELKVGDGAPTFDLQRLGAKKNVKLADLAGKPVVLIFGSCT